MSLVGQFSEITKTIKKFDDFGKDIGKSVTRIQDFGDKAVKTVTQIDKSAGQTLKTVNKSTWKAAAQYQEASAEAAKESKGAEGAQQIVSSLLEALLKFLQPILKFFKPLEGLFKIIEVGIGQALMPAIKRLIEALADPRVQEALLSLGFLIGTFVADMVDRVTGFVTRLNESGFFEALTALFNALAQAEWGFLLDIFTAFLGDLITWIEDINWEEFRDWIDDLVDEIVELVAVIADVVSAINTIIGALLTFGATLLGRRPGGGGGEEEEGLGVGMDKPFSPFKRWWPFMQEGGFVRRGGPVVLHDEERVLSAEATRALGLGESGDGMTGASKVFNITITGITDFGALMRRLKDESEFL